MKLCQFINESSSGKEWVVSNYLGNFSVLVTEVREKEWKIPNFIQNSKLANMGVEDSCYLNNLWLGSPCMISRTQHEEKRFVQNDELHCCMRLFASLKAPATATCIQSLYEGLSQSVISLVGSKRVVQLRATVLLRNCGGGKFI